MVRTLVIGLVAAAGCGQPEPVRGHRDEPLGYEPLDAARLLTRASLDLRGVRPSQADLEVLADDPSRLDGLIATYTQDERLESRVREWFAEVYLTRTDAYLVDTFSFDVDEQTRSRLQRDAGDEPLRIVGHIAANDLPITELVTGDWTMTNPFLASIFPVGFADGETGWQRTSYTDGRPAAGVLATNGMWWRYDSTDANANRKRANQVSRILLCDDFLLREIDFDRTDGLFDADFEQRTQDDPACAECHATLDPLASFLYGFTFYSYGGDEITLYHPEREREWERVTGVAPAYFGEPGSSLADLGRALGGDERFLSCTTRRVAEGLLGRTLDENDDDALQEHTWATVSQGLTFRAAMRSVIASPGYRAATDDGVPGGANPAKLARPALLSSAVQDLTTFSWNANGVDLMTSDLLGYLTLAGGLDGYTVTAPAESPGPTILLVQERLAEAAAEHAVRATLAEPGAVALLDPIDLTWTPTTNATAMRGVLGNAHLRALGRPATGTELDELVTLWSELLELEQDAQMAWSGVVSVLLRDPEFLLY